MINMHPKAGYWNIDDIDGPVTIYVFFCNDSLYTLKSNISIATQERICKEILMSSAFATNKIVI